MKKEDGHKKTYILTHGLGQKIKLLRHIGLKTPSSTDNFFLDFRTELESRIGKMLPDVKILGISMDDLADEILNKALEKSSLLKDAVIVSSCVELAIPRKGYVIEVNRIIDHQGKIIGLGARPGFPSLDEQIENLSRVAAGRPLIIVEDGAFTGSTMQHILHKLKEKHLQVVAVVVGFSFSGSMKKIQKEFDGEVIVVEDIKNPLDWMPDHDFFPFVPNCGRVLGVAINGEVYPFYTHDGASYSVPYITPFAPMDKWASIPKDHASSLSLFCLQKALELFERLERDNEKEIKIADLMGVRPRISIPTGVGQHVFPRLDTRITSFLSETCHELA